MFQGQWRKVGVRQDPAQDEKDPGWVAFHEELRCSDPDQERRKKSEWMKTVWAEVKGDAGIRVENQQLTVAGRGAGSREGSVGILRICTQPQETEPATKGQRDEGGGSERLPRARAAWRGFNYAAEAGAACLKSVARASKEEEGGQQG